MIVLCRQGDFPTDILLYLYPWFAKYLPIVS